MAGRPFSVVLWFSRQDDGRGAGGDEWSESKYILNVELVGFVLIDWMWERDRETYTERETSGVKDDWTIWRIELPSSEMEKTEGTVGPYWEEILSADTGLRHPIDIWQEGQLHGWIWIWSSGERSMQEIPNWQASRQSCCLKPQQCMRAWRMGTWGL